MASSSTEQDVNIQKLLEAEKKAQEIVAIAREKRAEKLKEAKSEAEKEIAAYRAEREQLYQNSMTEGSNVSDEVFSKLDNETNSTIKNIRKSLPERKKDVVDMLIGYVLNIDFKA